MGPIEFTSASGECEPFNVVKHLTTDRLKEKLGCRCGWNGITDGLGLSENE